MICREYLFWPGSTSHDLTDLCFSEASEGISPLLASMRANLRPTGQQLNGATNVADQDKDTPSTSSTSSPRSSVDLGRPTPRVKPNWLKRASMAPVLRTKSRSPAQSPIDLAPEPSSPRMSTHLTGSAHGVATPPALPPRKFPTGPLDTGYEVQAPPPQHPGRRDSISHHIPSISGKSRWGWGGGQGSTNGVSRSSSTNSILSTASAAHQRLPASAQRVLGTASHAVSRTWMRARGVGSNMSISTAAGSPHGQYDSAIASSPRSPGLLMRQLSRDSDFVPASEPLSWTDGVVRRAARSGLKPGRVFGRELEIAGRLYGVVEADAERAGDSEYERRRRLCLPAVVVRCVEYCECPSSCDVLTVQWSSGDRKRRASSGSAAGAAISLDSEGSLTRGPTLTCPYLNPATWIRTLSRASSKRTSENFLRQCSPSTWKTFLTTTY